jgi:hypothetical protein
LDASLLHYVIQLRRANGSQTLFFAERGSEQFAGYGLVDLGVTY